MAQTSADAELFRLVSGGGSQAWLPHALCRLDAVAERVDAVVVDLHRDVFAADGVFESGVPDVTGSGSPSDAGEGRTPG